MSYRTTLLVAFPPALDPLANIDRSFLFFVEFPSSWRCLSIDLGSSFECFLIFVGTWLYFLHTTAIMLLFLSH